MLFYAKNALSPTETVTVNYSYRVLSELYMKILSKICSVRLPNMARVPASRLVASSNVQSGASLPCWWNRPWEGHIRPDRLTLTVSDGGTASKWCLEQKEWSHCQQALEKQWQWVLAGSGIWRTVRLGLCSLAGRKEWNKGRGQGGYI